MVGAPKLIPESKNKEAKSKVDEAAKAVRGWTIPLKTSRQKQWNKILQENIETIGKAGWTFTNDLLDAVHSAGANSTIDADVKQLFQEQLEAGESVRKFCFDIEDYVRKAMNATPEPTKAPESLNGYWLPIFKGVVAKWLEEFEQRVEGAVASAYIYIDAAVQAYNKVEEGRMDEAWKKYNEEYDTDERSVEPVSDYGKSNIDEAFAEVFAHYVVGNDMNRGQLESFKSVLSSRTPKEQLFEAFLALL